VSRMRLLALVAAVAALGAVLWLQAAPGASARPADEAPRASAPPDVLSSTPPVAAPVRDIFSYAGEEDTESGEPAPAFESAPPAALSAPPSLADTAPPPMPDGPRLVGIVRQAGALRAALSVEGELVVVRVGERAGPYTVLSIDEENGVELREASGASVTLPAPQ
jgi:hypothetical protein